MDPAERTVGAEIEYEATEIRDDPRGDTGPGVEVHGAWANLTRRVDRSVTSTHGDGIDGIVVVTAEAPCSTSVASGAEGENDGVVAAKPGKAAVGRPDGTSRQ